MDLDQMPLVGSRAFLLNLADLAVLHGLAPIERAVHGRSAPHRPPVNDSVLRETRTEHWLADDLLIETVDEAVFDPIVASCVHLVAVLKVTQRSLVRSPRALHPSHIHRASIDQLGVHLLLEVFLHKMTKKVGLVHHWRNIITQQTNCLGII